MKHNQSFPAAIAMALAGAAVIFFAAISRADVYTAVDVTPSGFLVLPGFANPNPKGGSIAGTQYAGDLETQAGHQPQAILWTADGKTPLSVHPAGWSESHALATSGSWQVGYGIQTGGGLQHALLWNNTAASMIDLHPAALLPAGASQALAVSPSGAHQGGYGLGFSGSNQHALLWSGSAASAIDLNPAGFTNSAVNALTDSQQAGRGNGSTTGFQNHAIVWSGSAASAVDLDPAALSPSGSSEALGTDGSHQVGYVTGVGAGGGETHAYLWSGSAASGVDLNPAGFTLTKAFGVGAGLEAGEGLGAGGLWHALLWAGSSASATDLSTLLPSKFTYSYATTVDSTGDVFGFAFDPNSGLHAVEWATTGAPTPEPASLALLAIAVLPFMRRRKRR